MENLARFLSFGATGEPTILVDRFPTPVFQSTLDDEGESQRQRHTRQQESIPTSADDRTRARVVREPGRHDIQHTRQVLETRDVLDSLVPDAGPGWSSA